MRKIQDVLYQAYIRPHSRKLLILFLVAIFAVVGYYAYVRYAQPMTNPPAYKDVANANMRAGGVPAPKGDLELQMFHVDWCPHCVKSMPEWVRFCKQYDGKVIDGYYVTCAGGEAATNCTNSNDPKIQEMVQKYNIEHYPTLKIHKDNTVVDFDGKITFANLEKVIK